MSNPPAFDVTPFLTQDEGQHFDRKSLLHGPDRALPRKRKAVRDQVARYLAGFANAEGGVLILGMEDDGTVTGHRHSDKARNLLLQVPVARLEPPQPPGFVVVHDGKELLVFDQPTSDVPVRVTGDGFPLREGDQTVESTESKIKRLKFIGLVESWESQPSGLSVADLDAELLQDARRGAGLGALSDDDYLLRRKLADRRGGGLALRRAAELVFAAHGPDHANAGVRIFRVVGKERRLGAEHNVEELDRIEGNLGTVIQASIQTVGGLLRRPSRLVGTRFQPQPEYPDFSWREAVLNAIAHRDYSTEGRCVEVWLFDDRMEVFSPGGLVPGVDREALLGLHRVHSSRNPRLVRALVDLGYMRDQGEGIPRMFAEMESSFLPAPELQIEGARFGVILRNTLTLTDADRAFVAQLDAVVLEPIEFRVLLDAHRTGQTDNARLRRLTGLDTLQASAVLRRLRDRHLLRLHGAGSASYYTLGTGLQNGTSMDLENPPPDLEKRSADLENPPPDLENLPSDLEESQRVLEDPKHDLENLPPELRAQVQGLSRRPRRETLKPVILALCAHRPWSAGGLGRLLGRSNINEFVRGHLTPLVADGLLERTQRDPNHPNQAYRTTAKARSVASLFAPPSVEDA